VHEHSRADRDNYIQVLFENMTGDGSQGWLKDPAQYGDGPYDASSLMHYDSTEFSASGAPVALLVHPRADGTTWIAPPLTLSSADIASVARLYAVFHH
jgi:hypothetical protein